MGKSNIAAEQEAKEEFDGFLDKQNNGHPSGGGLFTSIDYNGGH